MPERDVIKNYKNALYRALRFVGLGLMPAIIMRCAGYSVPGWFITVAGIAGAVCEAVILYGFLGYEIQTWGGNTSAEELNKLWCNRMISAGIFFTVLVYSLPVRL